jgi:hypothetical protein
MRILAICKRESADCYVNPIGGVGLYDRAVFQRNGLTLYFVSSEEVVYRQFSQDFHPHLSIIDVLMHNGREKTKGLLSRYALI